MCVLCCVVTFGAVYVFHMCLLVRYRWVWVCVCVSADDII